MNYRGLIGLMAGAAAGGGGAAPPTFIGQSAIVSRDGTSGDVTPIIPSHEANDIIVVSAQTIAASGTISVSGWPEIGGLSEPGQGIHTRWFWLRASSGSTTDPTVNSDVNGYLRATAWVVRGCVTSGTPYEDATILGSDSFDDPLSSAIDTVGDNRLAVCSMIKYQNTAFTGGYPPATWTNGSNVSTADNLGARAIVMHKDVAAAGNVAQVTVGTFSDSKICATLTLAFIPS
jgi:hypothetical protein